MAHDADHSNQQHVERRRTLARPAGHTSPGPSLTETEILLRAARHIRLRPVTLDQVAGGDPSTGGPVPRTGDADA